MDEEEREEFEEAYALIADAVNDVIAEHSLTAATTLNVMATCLGRLTALAAKNAQGAQVLLERVVVIMSQACGIETKHMEENGDEADDSLSNQKQ